MEKSPRLLLFASLLIATSIVSSTVGAPLGELSLPSDPVVSVTQRDGTNVIPVTDETEAINFGILYQDQFNKSPNKAQFLDQFTKAFEISNGGAGLLTVTGVKTPAGFAMLDGIEMQNVPVNPEPDASDIGGRVGAIADPSRGIDIYLDGCETAYTNWRFAADGPLAISFDARWRDVANPPIIAVELGVETTYGAPAEIFHRDPFLQLGAASQKIQLNIPGSTGGGIRTPGKVKLRVSIPPTPDCRPLFSDTKSRLEIRNLTATTQGTDRFSIQLDPSKAGVFDGVVTFSTNDPNRPSVAIPVFGIVEEPVAPEPPTVVRPVVTLEDGSTVAERGAPVDFGRTGQGDPIVSKLVKVENPGTTLMTINRVVVPKGYKAELPSPVVIPAKGSAQVTVQMLTESGGNKSGAVEFRFAEKTLRPFRFNAKGQVVGIPTKPVASAQFHIQLTEPAKAPGSKSLVYTYDWKSASGEQVIRQKVKAREDRLRPKQDKITIDPKELWTVTVTPYNDLGVAGEAIMHSFMLDPETKYR